MKGKEKLKKDSFMHSFFPVKKKKSDTTTVSSAAAPAASSVSAATSENADSNAKQPHYRKVG